MCVDLVRAHLRGPGLREGTFVQKKACPCHPGSCHQDHVGVRSLVCSAGSGNMALEAGRLTDSFLFSPHCNWSGAGILRSPIQPRGCSAPLSQAATAPGPVELGVAGGAREDKLRPVLPPQASGSISPSSGHDPVSSSQTRRKGRNQHRDGHPGHPGCLSLRAPRPEPLGSLFVPLP